MRPPRQNPNRSLTVTTLSALLFMGGGIPARAFDQDSRIEAAARNSYNFRTLFQDDDIQVKSVYGVVILTGTVSAEFHRGLAGFTVGELPGVRSVDNRLSLAPGVPTPATDEWVALKVRSSLAFHREVSAQDTGVRAASGVVTLTGVAANDAERELAAAYADDVEGVTEVRNEMTVATPPHARPTFGETVDDISITAQIKTTLLFHKSVRSLATRVVTRDGVVTLGGEARSAAERDRVARFAGDVRGVKHVENRMTVAAE